MSAEDSMLPLLRLFHDAATDAQRAALLLQLPDTVLLKFLGGFDAACGRAGFALGQAYIGQRLAALRAVRTPYGELPEQARSGMATIQAAMVLVADAEGER